MFVRLLQSLAIAAVLTMAAPAAAAIHRIIAIGDLHGDSAAWRAIARAAGLIDGHSRWSGGAAVLVQTGDVVDRGPDSLGILTDLMRLQGEARRAGGQVVALVGNHEAMNMTGDLRYVSAADYAAFTDADSTRRRDQAWRVHGVAIELAYHRRDPAMTSEAIHAAWETATPLGRIEHELAWAPDGRIGRWVKANPAIVLLDGTLFIHAGLNSAYAAMPLAEINHRVAAALEARDTTPDSIINDEDGPLWYRGLAIEAQPPALPVGEQLDRLLAAQGATRIVIGHTPVLTGIAVTQGGRLIRIDTGISQAFGGQLSYLEILDGVATAHAVERPAGR